MVHEDLFPCTANEVKFAIYGAVDGSMKNRKLHLEPGTIGFINFAATE